jgi:hypothetical protein
MTKQEILRHETAALAMLHALYGMLKEAQEATRQVASIHRSGDSHYGKLSTGEQRGLRDDWIKSKAEMRGISLAYREARVWLDADVVRRHDREVEL